MDQYYEHRHVVDFEETNHVGNVYYINYVRWQGRCREMFLLEHAPSVLDWLCDDFELVTVEARCEYLAGIGAFDELSIRMRVAELTSAEIDLAFDYVRIYGDVEELVARGRQRVTCVRVVDAATTPIPVPEELRMALESYAINRPTRIGSVRLGVGGRALMMSVPSRIVP
jgi:enediyne core biosynthesis thioesterase